MTATKRSVLAVAAVLLTAGGVATEPVAAAPSRPAGPPMEPCPINPSTGTCHWGSGGPAGNGGSDGSNGSNGSSGSNGNGGDDGGDGDGGDGGTGAAPRPPTRPEIEAAVQRRVLVTASTYLRQPEVSFDDGRPEVGGAGGNTPGLDVDAHVGIATFVEVTNWQGQQVDRYAQTDPFGQEWWIRITATPRLSFRPGEPGAPTIRCEGGGTRYDPDGPSAGEQANRPGACAYQYTMRTGVDGRPDAWPAEVVVDWTIVWEANFPLPANLPQSDQLVEPVPREVGEISSVVVED